MSSLGPLHGLPIACTLTSGAGTEQVSKWRAFDDRYLLSVDRAGTEIVAHYAKVEDAVARLRELVAVESICCSFVEWAVDDSHADLRLIVTGTPEHLAVLDILSTEPPIA